MCSVVGYIGSRYSRAVVLEGLSRLEYRGYDSAGFACIDPREQQLVYAKATGALSNLVELMNQDAIDGHIGIGHTRWSTHGVPSYNNAHPQLDCHNKISVVHNGIIENHRELRDQLSATGHTFISATDTEIISHLLEVYSAECSSLAMTVSKVAQALHGAYACVAISEQYNQAMILIRKRSPLCIGIGTNEMFVASDVLAFGDKTNRVLFMPDESFALVYQDHIELYDFAGKPIEQTITTIDLNLQMPDKKGYEHFMLKEIFEQKAGIYATVSQLTALQDAVWAQMGVTLEQILQLKHVVIIACGTSSFAGSAARYFFESIGNIPTSVYLASEFKQGVLMHDVATTLYIAVSQSGETADTLEALRYIKELQGHIVVVTNVASSTMVREANGYLLTRAGPEVSVASTKAFTTQVAALYWLVHQIALVRNSINQSKAQAAQHDLLIAAEILEDTINRYQSIIDTQYAPQFSTYSKAIFLGRHISYVVAQEAALKLKEISYIFAQSYPAGELKHGPLALIDAQTPVFIFSHNDPAIYQKLLSNAQEVKARHGIVIACSFEGQTELQQLADVSFILPVSKPLLEPIVMAGLLQYWAYAIARVLGRPIDKPRNLAKSVTVE